MNSVKGWKEIGEDWRQRVLREIKLNVMGHFSFPQGALIMGFVFGDDADLPSRLRHYLKVTGMSHVTSASGYNVGLIISLCQPVISRFWGRRKASLCLLTAVWSYAWLAGLSASLWRAALMASLALIGSRWLERQIKPIRLLIITFICLFGLNRDLATSLSFQLSASATLGLLLFLPWINQGLALVWSGLPGLNDQKGTESHYLRKLTTVFTEAFTTTVAAQVFSIPILWHHFREFSLVSFMSNTFLLWIIPLITIAGFWGVGLGELVPWSWPKVVIMTPLSWFIWLLLEVFTRFLALFGHYNQGLIRLPNLSWLGVGLWWLAVLGFSWQLSQGKYINQNRKLNEIYAC